MEYFVFVKYFGIVSGVCLGVGSFGFFRSFRGSCRVVWVRIVG